MHELIGDPWNWAMVLMVVGLLYAFCRVVGALLSRRINFASKAKPVKQKRRLVEPYVVGRRDWE